MPKCRVERPSTGKRRTRRQSTTQPVAHDGRKHHDLAVQINHFFNSLGGDRAMRAYIAYWEVRARKFARRISASARSR